MSKILIDEAVVRQALRHDHRKSTWIIAGGSILWCYQCGAWRSNVPGRMKWNKPTGIGGANPAIKSPNFITKGKT
jgi:hypothetical protein